MKSHLREALKRFHELPQAGQDSLLRDLHRASTANALMIENRLLGKADFTEFLHEYGGGPDNYNAMGPAHLVAYLQLAKDHLSAEKASEVYAEVKRYIQSRDNMIQDYNFDAYESATGELCY